MNRIGNFLCKNGFHNHTIYKIDYVSINESYDYSICKRCKKKFKRRNDSHTLSCWMDEKLVNEMEKELGDSNE